MYIVHMLIQNITLLAQYNLIEATNAILMNIVHKLFNRALNLRILSNESLYV